MGGVSFGGRSKGSSAFIFQNPAGLAWLEDRYLIYEFQKVFSSLGGVLLSSRFDLHAFSSGAVIMGTGLEVMPNWGIMYQTLFRSVEEVVGGKNLVMKQFSVGTAFCLGAGSALGVKAGTLIGLEEDKSGRAVALTPSLWLSYEWRSERRDYGVGMSLLLPHWLRWVYNGGLVEETTPLIGRVGSFFDVGEYITLHVEGEYQGWRWVHYTNEEVSHASMGDNRGLRGVLEGVFLHVGVHFHGKVFYKEKEVFAGNVRFGFYPEVVYWGGGESVKMGNLTLGFSFQPFHMQSVRIHAGIVDKNALSLLKIFPHNTLQTTLHISTDVKF